MHQLPEITGQIQGSSTGIGEDIPGIFVGDIISLVFLVPIFNILHIICEAPFINSRRSYKLKPVLGTVPLAPLSEAAMPVSHQLMGTGSGDTFDFEGEVDMLHHRMMAVAVQMLDQSQWVLGVAVIADRCDLSNRFDWVGRCLDQSDIHS
jgi:hypothetical protein